MYSSGLTYVLAQLCGRITMCLLKECYKEQVINNE